MDGYGCWCLCGPTTSGLMIQAGSDLTSTRYTDALHVALLTNNALLCSNAGLTAMLNRRLLLRTTVTVIQCQKTKTVDYYRPTVKSLLI